MDEIKEAYPTEVDHASVLELLKEGASMYEACQFLQDSRGYSPVEAVICVDGAYAILNPLRPSPFAFL